MKRWLTALTVLVCTLFCLTSCQNNATMARVDYSLEAQDEWPDELPPSIPAVPNGWVMLSAADEHNVLLTVRGIDNSIRKAYIETLRQNGWTVNGEMDKTIVFRSKTEGQLIMNYDPASISLIWDQPVDK